MLKEALRAVVLLLEATTKATVPLPTPLAALFKVIQLGMLVTFHEQFAPAVIFTLTLPPALETEAALLESE